MKLQTLANALGCGLLITLTLQQFTKAENESVAKTPAAAEPTAIASVVTHLLGIMTTAEQASNDPNFVGVQMTTCQISVAGAMADSVYLYQEQALVENLSEPYRQRFLEIAPATNDAASRETTNGAAEYVQSNTFKPSNPSQWTDFCSQSTRRISTADLGEPACSVRLRPASIGGFVGSTPPEGCAANVRGAQSITNVVVLHSAGMDTWDRGFDANSNQVWGAEDIPYQYRRP